MQWSLAACRTGQRWGTCNFLPGQMGTLGNSSACTDRWVTPEPLVFWCVPQHPPNLHRSFLSQKTGQALSLLCYRMGKVYTLGCQEMAWFLGCSESPIGLCPFACFLRTSLQERVCMSRKMSVTLAHPKNRATPWVMLPSTPKRRFGESKELPLTKKIFQEWGGLDLLPRKSKLD